jgi:hypothetical protein
MEMNSNQLLDFVSNVISVSPESIVSYTIKYKNNKLSIRATSSNDVTHVANIDTSVFPYSDVVE